jgi:hypothetical protein
MKSYFLMNQPKNYNVFVICNFKNFFYGHKLEEGALQFIDMVITVWDVLAMMWATPTLTKNLTNFTLTEFKECL